MLHISPGVYVEIIDQSEYINSVPSAIEFHPFFSDRGKDNSLVFINGQKTLRTSFMVSDLSKQGKNFREGWICMDRWLSISGSAYGMRVLPDDATYANLLYAIDTSVSSTPILELVPIPDVNSEAELDTIIDGTTLTNTTPIALYSAYGRGEWYNDLSINLVEVINETDTYVIDVYEKDSGGQKYISKTHKVSFLENKVDLDGESLYIVDVLGKYSELINARVNQINFKALSTFKTAANVKAILATPPASPSDGDRYIVGVGATGDFATHDNEIAQYDGTGTTWVFTPVARGWVIFVGDTDPVQYLFDGDDWAVFDPVKGMFSAASTSDHDYKDLSEGGSGTLYNATTGLIDVTVGTQLLVEAYSGLIDDRVINTEFIYFPTVLCPYPLKDVSDAAVALSQYYRMDCFTFTTLPDSVGANEDIAEKQANYSYNTYMAALYGNHSRVYNVDMGRDIWVSPIYHMARVVPYTMSVASIADAPAGFDHAMVEDAKELRYVPLQGDRDNLYVERINYIAQFHNGKVVWQQLTSQMKNSSLSDINVVQVVLYIKRVVKTFCMNFIYYRNTPAVHARIQKALAEFLKDLTDNGYIQKFNVSVGSTEYEYKQKKCHVDVIIWPTKVIERFIVREYIR